MKRKYARAYINDDMAQYARDHQKRLGLNSFSAAVNSLLALSQAAGDPAAAGGTSARKKQNREIIDDLDGLI